jgi:hypothetical protein
MKKKIHSTLLSESYNIVPKLFKALRKKLEKTELTNNNLKKFL